MTDNIFGNRFLGRAPAWHWLGTVVDPAEQLDVDKALTLAGLDYEVRTTKLVTEAFGKRIDTGRVALVRQPTTDDPEPRVFGFVTPKYRPIQNRQLAELLQPISDANGWRVETLGALGRGEVVFMTLEAGEVEVPGDTSPVVVYFFVSNGHTGGAAVNIGITPIRIVCQNTLKLGKASATISASVAHTGDALGEVKFKADMVAQMQAAKASVTAAMRLLAATPVSTDQVTAILDAAYPQPVESRAVREARLFLESTVTLTDERKALLAGKVTKESNGFESIKLYKAAALDRLTIFNDEFPKVANTAWATYNAVVETEQYRRGKSDSTIGRDVLFGGWRGQVIERAWDAAFGLTTAAK